MKPTIHDIRRATAVYFNLTVDDILGPSHKVKIARPRMVAMTLAREMTPRSLPEIGALMGDRDHTTVLSAINRIRFLEEKSPAIKKAIVGVALISVRLCREREERERLWIKQALDSGEIIPSKEYSAPLQMAA